MTLEADFEAKLQEAVMDDVEERVAELMENFADVVHANLRAYGQRHGYNVEPAIESVSEVEVDRSDGRVSASVGWEDEQMGRWEFGVSPHTIDGDPLLSFVWESPPQWVREEFDQARSAGGQFSSGWRVFFSQTEHPGIPESRAVRDSVHALRRVIQA